MEEKNVVFIFRECCSSFFFFHLFLFALQRSSHLPIWCCCCCMMIQWCSAVALVAMQLVVLWSSNIPEQRRVDHGGVQGNTDPKLIFSHF